MSDQPRPIRDILAECMRRERLGLMRPLWEDWSRFDNEGCEIVRRRADHLIRILQDLGVELVPAGTPAGATTPVSPTIYQWPLVGQPSVERAIRKEKDDLWSIVLSKDGITEVEQSFSLMVVMLNAGLVLTDDPEAKTIPGLGRRLAAATEIYRLNAAGMGETR